MEKRDLAGLPIEFDRFLRIGAVDKSADLTDISSRRKKVGSVYIASLVRLFHKQWQCDDLRNREMNHV